MFKQKRTNKNNCSLDCRFFLTTFQFEVTIQFKIFFSYGISVGYQICVFFILTFSSNYSVKFVIQLKQICVFFFGLETWVRHKGPNVNLADLQALMKLFLKLSDRKAYRTGFIAEFE